MSLNKTVHHMQKLNKVWLESQKFQLDDALNSHSAGEDAFRALSKSHQTGNGMIRKLSRRGTYNTITFTDDNLLPNFLRKNSHAKHHPTIPIKVC